MRLPTQDSVTGRSIKTALQSIVGVLLGLVLAVWAVPGVPHAVVSYLDSNLLTVLLAVGLPSGIVTFVFNAVIRPELSKY